MAEYTLYSIGDSEFLFEIINSVAMIFGEPSMASLVKAGFGLGILATLFRSIFEGARNIEIQHFLIGLIMYGGFFVPKVDKVNIEDVYTGAVYTVDNVPLGVAFSGYVTSYIGYKTMEIFEVAYSDLGAASAPKLGEQGFAESLKVLTNIRRDGSNLAVWNAMDSSRGGGYVDFRRTWYNYIKYCTLQKVLVGGMKFNDLLSMKLDDALPYTHNLTTETFLESGNSSPMIRSCTEAYVDLNAATETALASDNVRKASDSLLRINSGTSGNTSFDKIDSSLDLTTAGNLSRGEFMKAAVLEPILAQAAEGKYKSMLDVNAAMMVNQALQQRNTQWATEQTLFQSIVRPMIAFFEGFIFAITPIMCFVLTLGKSGIQLAIRYFVLLIWVQLWYPLLSITNLYISMAARREINSFAGVDKFEWDSFYALNSAADIASTWVATGGMLAASVPVIAFMLIYGTSTTASAIAARMKGDHINEGYATPAASTTPAFVNQQAINSANQFTGANATGVGTSDLQTSLDLRTGASLNTTSSSQNASNQQSSYSGVLTNTSQSISSTGQDGKYSETMSAALNATPLGRQVASKLDIGTGKENSSSTNLEQGLSHNTTTKFGGGIKGGFDSSGSKTTTQQPDKEDKDDKTQSTNNPKTKSSSTVSGKAGASLDVSRMISTAELSKDGNSWTVQTKDGKSVTLSGQEYAQLVQANSQATQATLGRSATSSTSGSELQSETDNFLQAISTNTAYSTAASRIGSHGASTVATTSYSAPRLANSKAAMDILESGKKDFTPDDNDYFKDQYSRITTHDAYGNKSNNKAAALFNTYANGSEEQKATLFRALSAAGATMPGVNTGNAQENADLLPVSPVKPDSQIKAAGDRAANNGATSNVENISTNVQEQLKGAPTSERAQQQTDVLRNSEKQDLLDPNKSYDEGSSRVLNKGDDAIKEQAQDTKQRTGDILAANVRNDNFNTLMSAHVGSAWNNLNTAHLLDPDGQGYKTASEHIRDTGLKSAAAQALLQIESNPSLAESINKTAEGRAAYENIKDLPKEELQQLAADTGRLPSNLSSMSPEELRPVIDQLKQSHPDGKWDELFEKDNGESIKGLWSSWTSNSSPDGVDYSSYKELNGTVSMLSAYARAEVLSEYAENTKGDALAAGVSNPEMAKLFTVGSENRGQLLTFQGIDGAAEFVERIPLIGQAYSAINPQQIVDDPVSRNQAIYMASFSDEERNTLSQAKINMSGTESDDNKTTSIGEITNPHTGEKMQGFEVSKGDQLLYTYGTREGQEDPKLYVKLDDKTEDRETDIIIDNIVERGMLDSSHAGQSTVVDQNIRAREILQSDNAQTIHNQFSRNEK